MRSRIVPVIIFVPEGSTPPTVGLKTSVLFRNLNDHTLLSLSVREEEDSQHFYISGSSSFVETGETIALLYSSTLLAERISLLFVGIVRIRMLRGQAISSMRDRILPDMI